MRPFRREVGDHMIYRKNDRWPPYQFYAAEIANALHLRDFRSSAIFEFFNTISSKADIVAVRWHVSKVPRADMSCRADDAPSETRHKLVFSWKRCNGFVASLHDICAWLVSLGQYSRVNRRI